MRWTKSSSRPKRPSALRGDDRSDGGLAQIAHLTEAHPKDRRSSLTGTSQDKLSFTAVDVR